MAVGIGANPHPVTTFEDWYVDYRVDEKGCLEFRNIGDYGHHLDRTFLEYKREMDSRVAGYDVLEKLAGGEVINPKQDLPNVSSGETAGLIRRMTRNLVQNAPNVEVVSRYDDDEPQGIFARYILLQKVIGTGRYSNDMQQSLSASVRTALTLGFSCVVPVLLRQAGGEWIMKYDSIHYRDVFPEPGAKDVRDASTVFVRRYLSRGDVIGLIRSNAPGWDKAALSALLKTRPPSRETQSVDYQTAKHGTAPDGYEIITCYTNSGDPFLTFDARYKTLLRIEKNKHPLHEHPVHFLVLEKDDNQPLGVSQVELLIGRQDFQDLMLNGAMKLWYRNINPSIIGYGGINTLPNLSPGKYTDISNPNARVEAFQVNTQTLMQYGEISEQNLGNMVNLLGSADQQMAVQAGSGMSATPQGVEAQQQMVDVTTNNYQKAIESFFSHYCSYALTTYFAELAGTKEVLLTAEARRQLVEAGLDAKLIDDDSRLSMDFSELATEYFVRCVPGSLTELEDEKQLRILNQLFVPLSQAMPAIAAAQDPHMLRSAVQAMQYVIGKQIELSGSQSAKAIGLLWSGEDPEAVTAHDEQVAALDERIGGLAEQVTQEVDLTTEAIAELRENQQMMTEVLQQLLEQLGVINGGSESSSGNSASAALPSAPPVPTVAGASA